MKPSYKLTALTISLLLLCSGTMAQNTYQPDTTGYINFNLRGSTLPHAKHHMLTLCGCNTKITVDGTFWQGPKKGLLWNDTNQVLSGVPAGRQFDTTAKDSFYVSKYYIASPPVFRKNAKLTHETDTIYDIGLVTPDVFTFNGEKPAQMVYMDYSILKPMYIKYIKVIMDSTFDSLGVDYVPFKVECPNFPWFNANGIKDAKGASGIGVLNKSSNDTSQLFLPYYYVKDTGSKHGNDSTKKYLDCQVTILNDILFHREIFFMVNGVKSSHINLRHYNAAKQKPQISLHCIYRKELPAGCKQSKPQSPYKE